MVSKQKRHGNRSLLTPVKPSEHDTLIAKPRNPERSFIKVNRSVASKSVGKGGILAALRRSPLAGADLDLSRPRVDMRKVDL